MRVRLTDADRERIGAAVTAAETHTDGEIATVVTGASDRYRDTALGYAAAAMLVTGAVFALRPAWLEALAGGGDWGGAAPIGRLLLVLTIAEGIVFLAVRYALSALGWRIALTPHATCARRVRRRAVEFFRVAAEGRTLARVGVLLYLSTGERIAELITDEAVHRAVPQERWGAAMAALIGEVKHGRAADGMVAAMAEIGAILSEHFPKTSDDINELPDKVIEL